jgi:serine/threonine protein kinase
LDFFREGAKYYKVTEKVDLAGLDSPDVAALGFPAQLVLLKTVAHSLKILHGLEIVHSDLKPSNVLIKRTELGYTTKLIDFDSSYVVGKPPPPEEIVGTMNYYSPELVTYVQTGTGAERLSQASDIFALGLIYSQYLTGELPAFDAAYHEAAVAVLHGAVLRLPPSGAPAPVGALVERMLLPDPDARPTVGQVHATLMGLRSDAATRGRAPVPLRATVTSPAAPATSSTAAGTAGWGRRAAGSALRGKGLRLAGAASRPDDAVSSAAPPAHREAVSPPTAPAPTSSGRGGGALLGKLLGKLEDRRSR